jgi:hypothetical protein
MDIIPNVNPRPTAAAKPATPAAPAAKKPAGPIMEQRKIVAAQKAGMTVDARLYGVKPMELAKYINTMIKPGPYSGYVYNQKMMNLANISLMYTKTISADIKSIAVSNEKIKTGIGGAFGKMIGLMQQGNVITEREYREKEAAKQTGPPDLHNPAYLENVKTNALLHAILLDGKDEKNKAAKKVGGGFIRGLIGFFKNPLKFIWDMAGSVPFGRLILGGLTAGGIGFLLTKLFKNTSKALYDIFVPEGIKKFITGTKDFFEQWKNEGFFQFIGTRIGKIFGLIYDWFKDDFIKPMLANIMDMVDTVAFNTSHLFSKNLPELLKKHKEERAIEIYENSEEGKWEKEHPGIPFPKKERETVGSILSSRYDKEGNRIGSLGSEQYTSAPVSQKYFSEVAAKLAPYEKIIEKRLPKHAELLKGIITQESGANPNAYNVKSGATGMTQFMPATVKLFEKQQNRKFDPKKPADAIELAALLVEELDRTYKGDERKMLAGYNFGGVGMKKAGFDENKYPFETQEYIDKVLQYKNMFGGNIPSTEELPGATNVVGGLKPRTYEEMMGGQITTPAATSQPFIEPEKTTQQIEDAKKPKQGAYAPSKTEELLAQLNQNLITNTEVTRSQKINSTTTQTLSPVYS